VKIRIPKSTSKPPKLTPSQLKLQNLCTCDDDRSVCSETCGFPGEDDGAPANRMNFQVELVTPRAPAKAKPATHSCKQIQCEEENLPCCLPCRNCRAVYTKKKKGRQPKCCL
ncbi:jg27076, partial [Pararge aegeria aegeria]